MQVRCVELLPLCVGCSTHAHIHICLMICCLESFSDAEQSLPKRSFIIPGSRGSFFLSSLLFASLLLHLGEIEARRLYLARAECVFCFSFETF